MDQPKAYSFIDLHAIALQAMANYGFVPLIPQSVVREAHRFELPDFNAKLKDTTIRDLRELAWSSIDNHDSLDLDQIEYCERAPNLEIRVLVAIADVDALVEKSTATDRHARENGTSVYSGVEMFPMLPENLCTNLTSLKFGEDRLAVVMEYFVLKDGSVRTGNVFRAVVRNRAKLVYETVGDWLEGTGPIPDAVTQAPGIEEQLRIQDEAAGRLRDYRIKNGALELETIEPSTIMADGTVSDLVVRQKNRARYIIENFMVAANGTMVAFLEKKGSPMIQRVVRVPERWPRIREIALSYGTELPEDPDPKALSDFMIKRNEADPDHFPDLSVTIVKLIGQGEYVLTEPGKPKIGHFGLAVQDYTHATAPNRRYVDIIVQRLLKAALVGEPVPYAKTELSSIADWCTDRSHNARKVERFMRKVAAAVLLQKHIGEVFDAIVTGVSDKGTFARLIKPPAEGRILRNEKGLDVGEKISVKLISLEPEKGFIDFERVRQN